MIGLVYFGSKSCIFLAVCGQIWQKFWGTYDLRSELEVYKISANLVHRELRNATFEGKKSLTLSLRFPSLVSRPL